MNFDLTEDRRMLADTLTRYLSDNYAIKARNEIAYAAPFHDPAGWRRMAELGIVGGLVPEEAGGLGGAGFDIVVVFEVLGRHLCPEPFLGALLASRLLSAAGEDQSALIDGSCRYAVGLDEIDAPYGLEGMRAGAWRDGDGYRVSGRKCAAYGANDADVLLVAALLEGKPALFRVENAATRVVGYGMIDGGGAAEILLDESPATLLIADAGEAVDGAVQAGQLALCAEAVGAMGAAYDLLLDYLGTRRQFGTTIGSFQAIQHRTVDLLTEIEQARSITIAAAAELDGPRGALTVAMAKNLIGRAARLVAEETIQLQGGIAMTWEYAAAHYAKRLVMLDHQLGDTDHCLGVVMDTYAA
ncbi:MAG: acyl-CoA dehydrogenase family protein [Pseudochelatococcus sp.]|jgi:alkylation response protein AidB-like acyl-CoA dehydrogenase|uniref:acyl-CoA dehydrogenase family protein n=1 Tax=Pseudochelatococcus sp. TaxID=2020869 RepID=UPI003D913772